MKCDPAIKSILVKIDSENGHRFIIDSDLGEDHVFCRKDSVAELKRLLDDVRFSLV